MRERIHETILDNGLKVLTVRNPISPTASLQVWYRVGSRNERPGITGASHIVEHLMFKGTERYPKGAFDRAIQENGMVNNAFTGHDFTAYFENMARDRLEIAFDLESDRMQGLLFDPDEFRAEMAVIREERRETSEDPPFGRISEEVEAAAFLVHPYHWPVIGWMTDLETVTLEEIVAHYRLHYRPNNAVLVVAGDVEHREVVTLADRYFGPIPAGPPVPPVRIEEPDQTGERTVSVHKEVQLPGLVIAYRIVSGTDPAAPALNVAESLLFRGRSSRLYRRVVHDEPLAAALAGGFHLRKDPSTMVLRATAQPGVEIERLREAICETIESLDRVPPTEEEMSKAKNQMEADLVFGMEQNYELGQTLGSEECRTSWEEWFRFYDRCLAVTADDVIAAASKHLTARRRTTGFLLPEKGSR
ncbi:MAG: insulinase family protein [Candidatus Eisenbacteria bacterium]|nr:insulinase family protein [Candidatus Latescibacterota bacterium]MBD3303299.1 insulinase family protein [Candidatus Eisenbacteria bacterium]